jgi:hypothetical protein
VGNTLVSTGPSRSASAPAPAPAAWAPAAAAPATTSAAKPAADGEFVTRTYRVGHALVSVREPVVKSAATSSSSTVRPAAAAAPAVQWSAAAAPAKKFEGRTWRLGNVLVSTRDAAPSARPASAPAPAATSWSSYSSAPAAAAPAAGEKKFEGRTWRVGNVLLSDASPRRAPTPAPAVATSSYSSYASAAPTTSASSWTAAAPAAAREEAFVTRTWRVGNALVSAREPVRASSAPPHAPAYAPPPARSSSYAAPAPSASSAPAASKFEGRTWRVGNTLLSTGPSRSACAGGGGAAGGEADVAGWDDARLCLNRLLMYIRTATSNSPGRTSDDQPTRRLFRPPRGQRRLA